MSAAPLRIGTRASALALWQAERVAALIAAQPQAPAVSLVHIKTAGDVQNEVPLWQVDGRAFFTREIDRALLDHTVDVAVHSLKDLATRLEPGLTLAAMLPRADPRDALLSAHGLRLAQLPHGARIGTSSLRRRAFLARSRPDARLCELRGNVPTRLERLRRGEYDAIVLAAAGLERLGLTGHITQLLPVEEFPPAVSQGVIGVCARAGDAATLRWLNSFDDPAARLESAAERALLARLEGGCQVPLGALARLEQDALALGASVCALDGTRALTVRGRSPATAVAAQALGVRLADELLAAGASELIAAERAARSVEAP
jgi:hydroxymethylbilane synthase